MGDIWLSENFESINREKKNLRKIKRRNISIYASQKNSAKTNRISGACNNVKY